MIGLLHNKIEWRIVNQTRKEHFNKADSAADLASASSRLITRGVIITHNIQLKGVTTNTEQSDKNKIPRIHIDRKLKQQEWKS